jgi:hypothetical protein
MSSWSMVEGWVVVAHLLEFPDYYKRLKTMETRAETYWGKRKKPSILLP